MHKKAFETKDLAEKLNNFKVQSNQKELWKRMLSTKN